MNVEQLYNALDVLCTQYRVIAVFALNEFSILVVASGIRPTYDLS